MDEPSSLPSRTTIVFTDPARVAKSSTSSRNGMTAALYGTVTFAPANPLSTSEATVSSSSSSSTGMSTYFQSRPNAWNAALCMRGESECATGLPRSPTRLSTAVRRAGRRRTRPSSQ